MSNNFDGPVILDSAAVAGGYLGTGGRLVNQSIGPRISGGDPANPNGVLSAIRGSLHLTDTPDLWINTDGATAWALVASGSASNPRIWADPGLAAIPANLFVDNTTGSDVTGDGTAANPWATLTKAMFQIPILSDNARVINLATSPTPYSVAARTLIDFSLCTIKGELIDDGQGKLTSTVGTGGSEAAGTNVEVAGAGWVVDEHVGKFILWDTGALAGRYGIVYSNDADTLMVTTQNTSYTAPVAGDMFALLVHGTSIAYSAGTVNNGQTDASNHNLRYEDVSINADATGFSTWAVASLARINFRRCSFGQNIECITVADGGRARIQTCYVNTLGQTFADRGLINCGSNGSAELFQGTVVDARFATSVNPAQSGISCKGASSPQWQGELVIRGLGSLGYNLEGLIAGTNDNAGNMNLIRFVNCQSGITINENIEEGGGYYGIPDLHGTITGDYVVTAQHGAQVTIGDVWPALGGTAVSALGTMAVSANNGVSHCSFSEDRTLIYGGTPVGGESVDPGNGNPIPPTLQGVVPLQFAGAAETNTLGSPFRPGQSLTLFADPSAAGSRIVTFSAPMNTAGDTIATFTAAGQVLQLVGVILAGVETWRVVGNDGVTLT